MNFAKPNPKLSYNDMKKLTKPQLIALIKDPFVHKKPWYWHRIDLMDILNYELNIEGGE